jgi:hypothetical protein
MASSVKRGKGSETAIGETPLSANPISSMVHVLLGGWKLRCFAGSNAGAFGVLGAMLSRSDSGLFLLPEPKEEAG